MHATCCSIEAQSLSDRGAQGGREGDWKKRPFQGSSSTSYTARKRLCKRNKYLKMRACSGSQKRPSLAKANLANFLARVTLQGGRIRDRFQRMTNVTFRRFLLCWSIPSWRDLAKKDIQLHNTHLDLGQGSWGGYVHATILTTSRLDSTTKVWDTVCYNLYDCWHSAGICFLSYYHVTQESLGASSLRFSDLLKLQGKGWWSQWSYGKFFPVRMELTDFRSSSPFFCKLYLQIN